VFRSSSARLELIGAGEPSVIPPELAGVRRAERGALRCNCQRVPTFRVVISPEAPELSGQVLPSGARSMAKSRFHCNNSTIVRNIGGTSSSRFKIARLSTKFERRGGSVVSKCQAKQCGKPVSATAHVRVVDGRRKEGQAWHLCRVCAAHNHVRNAAPFALRKNAKLVAVSAVRQKVKRRVPKKAAAKPAPKKKAARK
jgi:hypothetical protein